MKFQTIFATILFLLSATCFAKDVNINHASAEEISKSLKGIGIKKAELIVEYRRKHGPYKSVEELIKIKGIGTKIVSQNREDIRLK